MAKKIQMDEGYDKEIADAIKRGKQLDKEIAKSKGKKVTSTAKTSTTKKKVKRTK